MSPPAPGPRPPTPFPPPLRSRYLIGIDLGTTNSALAYIDTQEPAGANNVPFVHVFEVPQLVAEGEVRDVPALPSFLYFADPHQSASGGLSLPWDEHPNSVVGVLAREQGALVPGRQIASAKSWLSLASVDRTAKILPWGTNESEQACSPVEASADYLAHLRDAWNYRIAAGHGDEDERRFEKQEIVLTVPASFDEEARELTVQAARDAGIERLTLLEEPLAAFYAWIAVHQRELKRQLKDNQSVLICDVGGGTTDFSLIRVRILDKQVRFERTAIGEHLLLGGDNVDLALARRIEEKLGNPSLTLRQRNALQRQCCAAKERLLNDPAMERLPITVLGSGRSVVGSALTTELTGEEVIETLAEGFLPLTSADDLPAPRGRRTGLRELGLPYASEPAITKHLAQFLTQAAAAMHPEPEAEEEFQQTAEPASANSVRLVRPDAVLFNGGFFASLITRERVVEAIVNWFSQKGKRWRPKVLANEPLESAVAVGAAYYGLVRLGEGIRISGGSARGYYVGVQVGDAPHAEDRVRAVCVMPRGTEEGTTLQLADRDFTVLTNRPVSFTLYSSTVRHDAQGQVVTLDEAESHRHAPLITVLRYGKRSRDIELAVRLSVSFTEVGTLELWCESQQTEHRWRLQFQLRGASVDHETEETQLEEAQTIIADEAVETAARMIRHVFGEARDAIEGEHLTPEVLTGKLEAALQYRKDSWPIVTIRQLCDVLAQTATGRKKGRQYEARWLNLFGFCLRPGFGAVLDDWRIAQARKIYLEGLIFPKDLQCQVEWLILWRRVVGGFSAGQQQELYERHAALLGIGGKKRAGYLNRQVEQEGWLLLAGLEHLPAPVRVKLGEELMGKISEEPDNKGFQWALGRLGARIPFDGPLNCVVPAEWVERWLTRLLALPEITPHVASAVAQLGARTDDPARDINDNLRLTIITRLSKAGINSELIESLRTYVSPTRSSAIRIFGESLPEGLRLVG